MHLLNSICYFKKFIFDIFTKYPWDDGWLYILFNENAWENNNEHDKHPISNNTCLSHHKLIGFIGLFQICTKLIVSWDHVFCTQILCL